MQWTIYKITSLSTGLSYIGQTRRPKQRKLEHLRDFPERYEAGFRWDVLAICASQADACTEEAAQIVLHGTAHPKGLNLETGGLRNFHHAKTSREKLRLAALGNTRCAGRRFSEETKLQMSVTRRALWKDRVHPLKGRKKSAEHVEKIAAAHRGKPSKRKGVPMPEHQRLAMSAARKGKPPGNQGMPRTDAARARIKAGIQAGHARRAAERDAAAAAGLAPPPNNYRRPKGSRGPLSDEVKAKIRAGNLGRKHTEEALAKMRMKRGPQAVQRTSEHNAKIGAAHRGMKRSPEARARIAAGIRAAHARRLALKSTAENEPPPQPPV